MTIKLVPPPAIGLTIELHLECSDDEINEALFDELDLQLAMAADVCVSAGLEVVATTGNVLVAVAPLPADPVLARSERTRVMQVALALGEQLWQRPSSGGRLKAGLTMHIGPLCGGAAKRAMDVARVRWKRAGSPQWQRRFPKLSLVRN